MNCVDVRAVRMQGRFAAQFRRVHRADYETVEDNGETVLFETEDKAKVAGWEALTAHINTIMRRSGETVAADARSKAEALFKGKPDGKGKEAAETSL